MSTIYVFLSLALTISVFAFLMKKIKSLSDYIDELEGNMTTLQSHTDGVFNNVHSSLKNIEDKLDYHIHKYDYHMHKYEFKDGVLYIQEPIIVEHNNEEPND